MTDAKRAAAASLAHGLAHEVAALAEARRLLVQMSGADAFAELERMIDARKQRVAVLGAEACGHA
jgi:hypothetical protein